jgi:integrase
LIDGTSQRISATGPSKAKAINALKARAQKVRLTARGDIEQETDMETAVRIWVASLTHRVEEETLVQRTADLYIHHAEHDVIPAFGSLRVAEVGPSAVARWTHALPPGNRKVAGTVLRQVLDLAVTHGAIPTNPARAVPRASKRKHARPVRALLAAELTAVHDAIGRWEEIPRRRKGGPAERSLPLRTAIGLQLVTGTRIGEALAIRPVDIDFTHGLVVISGTLTYDSAGGLHRQSWPKTTSGWRALPMPPSAMAMLRELIPIGGEDEIGPVLSSSAGTWLWPHNVRRAWREARALADIDLTWVVPHTFRKTVAAEVGDEKRAAAFLGHSDSRVTRDHYIPKPDRAPDVTDVLDGLTKGWW